MNLSAQFLSILLAFFLAGCTPGASSDAPAGPPAGEAPIKALILGGGSSHDFDRWFDQEDTAVLRKAGIDVRYTDRPADLAGALDTLDVLMISTNQPIPDTALRAAIMAFADAGNGLVLYHPGVWYNWEDWPAYSRQLVGGGSRSHGPYGNFEVTIANREHPITLGVTPQFSLDDELYRFEVDPDGPGIDVLAEGHETDSGTDYPILWTVRHPSARIVGFTLGHDAAAHESAPYRQLLVNSVRWAADRVDMP